MHARMHVWDLYPAAVTLYAKVKQKLTPSELAFTINAGCLTSKGSFRLFGCSSFCRLPPRTCSEESPCGDLSARSALEVAPG